MDTRIKSLTIVALTASLGLWLIAVMPATAAPSTVNVNIQDYSFTPQSITVVIGVNNTITWTNNGNQQHTVTANDGSFSNSGTLAPGATYTHTFTAPGDFDYHCAIHSSMTGVVVVKLGSTATSSSTTSASSGEGQGSIPEFPIQFGIVTLVTLLTTCFYVLVRRGSLGGMRTGVQ